MSTPQQLFSYRKYWAERFGVAPVLPMSRAEMDDLGWDSCDVILVTGDAYVDHPSFGMALIGRLLEAQGFRVGIISQPDWKDVNAFRALGQPNLFFGVTSGNMDSMVNRYTADCRIRSDDAYTPDAEPNKRPDRAVLVYSQRCREAFSEVPIVLGGIEASLRRIAHYDYWSDKVRRSVLVDAKADILLYGNAERALVELAHRLARRENISEIHDLRGSVVFGASELANVIKLPSYEEVQSNPQLCAEATRQLYLESNPNNARILTQQHGERVITINPPPIPLTTPELDHVYELPYSRKPHPIYKDAKLPAYEMIKCSVTIMRGCFGGCSFCSITGHEGRIIQNRSQESVLNEIKEIRDRTPGFTGIISDLGGPSANMYHLECQNGKAQQSCRKFSCIYPNICTNMSCNHAPLIALYRKARAIDGIKKVFIASGVRYDLAIKSPEYVKELVTHHVGGYLKIAPEHVAAQPLAHMLKPGIKIYDRFQELFQRYSNACGKEQYIIPYFIAAHPGTTDEDMLELALWLKKNKFRLDKVQNFIPTPMTLATAMYHSGVSPLNNKGEKVVVPKGGRVRRLHKAFLRYHDPHNWPILRQALQRMGREDLIGNGKRYLVPSWQPKDLQKNR